MIAPSDEQADSMKPAKGVVRAVAFLAASCIVVLAGSLRTRGFSSPGPWTSASGLAAIAGGVAMILMFRAVDLGHDRILLRRTLMLNPGLVAVLAGGGILCVGHPESAGLSLLMTAGIIALILVSFGMLVAHLRRRRNWTAIPHQ